MNKHIQFSDLLFWTFLALFIGGGLYGFLGPDRLMGCDGVVAEDWFSRNVVCPSFSALIIMSAISMWVAGGLWVFFLVRDKCQK